MQILRLTCVSAAVDARPAADPWSQRLHPRLKWQYHHDDGQKSGMMSRNVIENRVENENEKRFLQHHSDRQNCDDKISQTHLDRRTYGTGKEKKRKKKKIKTKTRRMKNVCFGLRECVRASIFGEGY